MNKALNKPFYHFIALSLMVSIGWLLLAGHTPALEPDSAGYLEFSSTRTLAYPTFLYVVMHYLGGIKTVQWLQLFFIAASSVFVTTQFYRWTTSRILSYLLLLGLMLNPANIYAFKILTEALAITMIHLSLGYILHMTRQPRFGVFLQFSVVVALAILIRPVHYALLPLFLLIVGLAPFSWIRKLFITIPLVTLLMIGATFHYFYHGFWGTQSFTGHNLIGKAALIMPLNTTLSEPILKDIGDATQEMQTYLSSIPTLQMRYSVIAPYYDEFRYRLLPNIEKKYGTWNDNDLLRIALHIIKNHPQHYLFDVLLNEMALWELLDLKTAQEKTQFNAFLLAHTPPQLENYPLISDLKWRNTPWVVIPLRCELWLCCVLSLLTILKGFIQIIKRQPLSPIMSALFYFALLLHGHFLLIALLQAGLPRYSLPFLGVNLSFMLLFLFHVITLKKPRFFG